MPINVQIPSLGDSVSEAVLLRWLKKEGEYVKTDETLCELETDKANVEIPAPADGVLHRGKSEGQTVQVGETIAHIEESAAPAAKPVEQMSAPAAVATAAKGNSASTATATAAVPAAPATPPTVASTSKSAEDLRPSVRRIATEQHIDTAAIAGTGPRGAVLKEDVLKAVQTSNGNPPRDAAPASPATASAPSRPASQHAAPSDPNAAMTFNGDGINRVPMSKFRKRIAARLVNAQQTAAILTTFNEVDLSAVLSLRTKYKDRFNEVYGVGLGLMSFFARAVVLGLREFPRINAEIQEDDIIYHQYVHLGIAVSTERGLVVPVLRHAESMSFAKVESEIKRVATAARDGKLGLDELDGGTFTITNGGVFGSLLSTPILNPPQSGILGMHTIQKRPVAVGDKVEIRPMMYTALSYDHRLVDGKESVSFLVRLKEYLEDPARLMLEI